MNSANFQLRNVCIRLVAFFETNNNHNNHEIISKLTWCIGSFDHDHNAIGLVEYGEKAYAIIDELLTESNNKEGLQLKIELREILDEFDNF
jgi:hypothetical protein